MEGHHRKLARLLAFPHDAVPGLVSAEWDEALSDGAHDGNYGVGMA
jgi:hypothetical protein